MAEDTNHNQPDHYKRLGFRCGLEIHQQLDGKKLFCDCPTINSTKEPDTKIMRRLRVSASELGKVDAAAMYESKKDRYFLYEGNSEDTCLVEFDDEPPHKVNQDSLKTALIISKLLNCRIVDEIHFMRKIVIDGSNVSGFQRTALVAVDGWIETPKGKVGVPTICLEEEAAQKAEDTKEFVRFKLDRLGIPLVEIATDATIKDPDHAKEAAAYIGMVLRSVEGVKRGLGTIRQDINVSLEGHPRVEIKGFQDLRAIPKTIDNEIKRQLEELKERKKLEAHVRKAEPDFTTTYLRPMPGADRMYPETDVEAIKPVTTGLKLPKLLSDRSGELKEQGLSEELASTIVKSPEEMALFERFTAIFKNLEPKFIANTLIATPKEMKKRYNIEPKLDEASLTKILAEADAGRISKEAVLELWVMVSEGKPLDFSKFLQMDDATLEKEIKRIADENKGMPQNAMVGKVMGVLRGKADGKKIVEILKKYAGP